MATTKHISLDEKTLRIMEELGIHNISGFLKEKVLEEKYKGKKADKVVCKMCGREERVRNLPAAQIKNYACASCLKGIEEECKNHNTRVYKEKRLFGL